MWNTPNSNGYINGDGSTLVQTKSSCMSPTLSIQYNYKDDTLPFENSSTSSYYIYNMNTNNQSNTSPSKSSAQNEATTNLLSTEQVSATNREVLDLIYSRAQSHQQEYTNMSSVENNSEFNNANNNSESNYGLEFNSSYTTSENMNSSSITNNGVMYHHLLQEHHQQQQQNNTSTSVISTSDTILNSTDISNVAHSNNTENNMGEHHQNRQLDNASITNIYGSDSFGKNQNFYLNISNNSNNSNNINANMQHHQEEYQSNSIWNNHDHLSSISINGYSYSPYGCASSCFNTKQSENLLSINENLEQSMSSLEKSVGKKQFNKSFSNRSVNSFAISNEASSKTQANTSNGANLINSNMFGDSSSSTSSSNSSGVFGLSKSNSKKNFSGNFKFIYFIFYLKRLGFDKVFGGFSFFLLQTIFQLCCVDMGVFFPKSSLLLAILHVHGHL